jgi:hypothetical protein
MAMILKANKVNLFVSFVLFVFWYHSPNFLDTPHITDGQFMNSTQLTDRGIRQVSTHCTKAPQNVTKFTPTVTACGKNVARIFRAT